MAGRLSRPPIARGARDEGRPAAAKTGARAGRGCAAARPAAAGPRAGPVGVQAPMDVRGAAGGRRPAAGFRQWARRGAGGGFGVGRENASNASSGGCQAVNTHFSANARVNLRGSGTPPAQAAPVACRPVCAGRGRAGPAGARRVPRGAARRAGGGWTSRGVTRLEE